MAMEIIGPMPKKRNGNRFVVVIPDRYFKLREAINTKTTPELKVAIIFMDYWILPYEIPELKLTKNGTQFIGKFFNELSPIWRLSA